MKFRLESTTTSKIFGVLALLFFIGSIYMWSEIAALHAIFILIFALGNCSLVFNNDSETSKFNITVGSVSTTETKQ